MVFVRGGVWVARSVGRVRGGGVGVVWFCCRFFGIWRRGGSRVGCWVLFSWVLVFVGVGVRVGYVIFFLFLYRVGERAVRRVGRVARISRRYV